MCVFLSILQYSFMLCMHLFLCTNVFLHVPVILCYNSDVHVNEINSIVAGLIGKNDLIHMKSIQVGTLKQLSNDILTCLLTRCIAVNSKQHATPCLLIVICSYNLLSVCYCISFQHSYTLTCMCYRYTCKFSKLCIFTASLCIYTVICFFLLYNNFRMQNLCGNFLHENFYTRLNYSNRAVIYGNHTKIFLRKNFYYENFLHKNKANYGSQQSHRGREWHSSHTAIRVIALHVYILYACFVKRCFVNRTVFKYTMPSATFNLKH